MRTFDGADSLGRVRRKHRVIRSWLTSSGQFPSLSVLVSQVLIRFPAVRYLARERIPLDAVSYLERDVAQQIRFGEGPGVAEMGARLEARLDAANPIGVDFFIVPLHRRRLRVRLHLFPVKRPAVWWQASPRADPYQPSATRVFPGDLGRRHFTAVVPQQLQRRMHSP